jgi:hypothetical protein
MVVSEASLRRVLAGYVTYPIALAHASHAREMTASVPRIVQPHSAGRIVATPEVGGLHHRYDRVAA